MKLDKQIVAIEVYFIDLFLLSPQPLAPHFLNLFQLQTEVARDRERGESE